MRHPALNADEPGGPRPTVLMNQFPLAPRQSFLITARGEDRAPHSGRGAGEPAQPGGSPLRTTLTPSEFFFDLEER